MTDLKQGLVYVLVIVIVIAGVGFGSTENSTSAITSNNSSMLDTLGVVSNTTNSYMVNRDEVALVLHLSTSIVSGSTDRIAITVKLVNTLDSENDLPLGSTFPNGTYSQLAYDQNLSMVPMDPCIFPGAAVLHMGYYTAQNLSSGQARWLEFPGSSCPWISASFYDFNPLSDNATYTNYTAWTGPPYSLFEGTINTTGYWTRYLSGTTLSYQYHTFETGTYTIMAVDVWGDLVLLHFTVQ